MAIKWNYEVMTTGSASTDEEHREWIERFNTFEAAVRDQLSAATINHTLQLFTEYSNIHFPHEEFLMEQQKCPAAALNRFEHNKFREKLQQIQTLILLGGTHLSEILRLNKDVENWLVNHISRVDGQMRPAKPFPNTTRTPQQPATPISFSEQLNTTFPGNFVEAVLQSSPDVIIIVDELGNIVFASGRCKDLLDYEPLELPGKNVNVLVPAQHSWHGEMREKYWQNPQPRAMGKRPVLSAQHKSGAMIPVDIALSPLPTPDGAQRLVQVVIRDAMPRWNTQFDLLVQSVALNAAANGIVLTDMQGVIQWVNPAVTRMTGYTSSELIGKTPRMLKSGQHDAAFYQNLWQTVMAGNTWFGEIINKRKDGSLYYEEQHIAPVRNEEGHITRLIAIKQDVTARRLAEMKLQETNQELEKQLAKNKRLTDLLSEANKALEGKVAQRTAELARSNKALEQANQQLLELDSLKSSFLGVISHELRTPFVSIIMSSQLIESYGLEFLQPEQRELFQQLNDNIRAARTMIENLVNYASFVRKQGKLRLTPINLKTVVETTMLPYQFQAGRKGLTLCTDLPADLPPVRGDEERLGDAISQLLDNAIKFTNAGGQVTLRGWQAGGILHLAVQDSGVGVPADKLPVLWESFAQMADPLRRGREGLGLGLALVEYIIRAHQGEVWAESEVGKGSTFGFRLPVEIE
jgi:PAS domain S-box-containing protein/hemerythrin-like metal-binding protein